MGKPDASHLPYESFFVPEVLTEEHRIKFACHPGFLCFNESLQLLFMATYELDRFKRFITSPSFKSVYNLDDKTDNEIQNHDIALLSFGYRFLRQVLFGEKTIVLHEETVKKRSEERKDIRQAHHQAEMEYSQLNEPRCDPAVMGDEVMRDDMLKAEEAACQQQQGEEKE